LDVERDVGVAERAGRGEFELELGGARILECRRACFTGLERLVEGDEDLHESARVGDPIVHGGVGVADGATDLERVELPPIHGAGGLDQQAGAVDLLAVDLAVGVLDVGPTAVDAVAERCVERAGGAEGLRAGAGRETDRGEGDRSERGVGGPTRIYVLREGLIRR
jgi:hypothetical protein